MDVSSIEDVIKDASQGKIFILIDDENRENEGDLCVLGDFVNPNGHTWKRFNLFSNYQAAI